MYGILVYVWNIRRPLPAVERVGDPFTHLATTHQHRHTITHAFHHTSTKQQSNKATKQQSNKANT